MAAPGVSVVMPVFNAAGTLPEALASLADQTLRDWECVVVDDGSTDGSAALVRGWASRDRRFRLVERDHRGIVASLNAGIAAARAPIIARMDADDVALPRRLAAQAAYLGERRDIGVVGCLVEDPPGHRSAEGFARYVRWTNGLRSPEEHLLNRFIESPLVHPTAAFRRELAARWGGYRSVPQWPEDYELWLRWMHRGVRFAKIPEVLFRWRDSPGRLSRSDGRYAEDAFYRLKAYYAALGPLRDRREVGVWGAGRVTRRRAGLLRAYGIEISFYVDIDPRKVGKRVGGRPVIGPRELAGAPDVPLLAYVASRGAREAIRAAVRGTTYVEGEDFWCMA